MVYNLVSERYGVVRLCKAIDERLSADNQVKIKRRLYKLNITLIE